MQLSLAEQVTGRRQQVMFQVELRYDEAQILLQKLKLYFPGMGVHYWMTPVLESGRIG